MPETFVLDCSVAAKWIFPEPDRAPALGWFERYASGEVLLIAPDLLLAEFASLLAKRNRRKQISALQAQEAFSLMTKCAPQLSDTRLRLFYALDLSLQYQLSVWDCVYLALALERDCPLLTADLRLFRAGRGRHPSIQLLQGSLPA
jgi:predicted nucleic acid-binding protein